MSNNAGSIANTVQIVNEHRTFNAALEIISKAKETFDCCIDSKGLSFLMQDEQLWNVVRGLKNRNVISRFITEITQENMHSCNSLLKLG